MVNKEVWIILEQEKGKISRHSLELFSGGRKLAEKSSSILAGIGWGTNLETLIQSAKDFGAKKFYLGKNITEDYPQVESIAYNLGKQILHFSPFLVLFGANPKSQNLALHISSNLFLPFLSNCESIEIKSDGQIIATRPTYNGNFSTEVASKGEKTTLASVIPRKWNPEPARSPVSSCELIEFVQLSEEPIFSSYEILERIKIDPQDMDFSKKDKLGKNL